MAGHKQNKGKFIVELRSYTLKPVSRGSTGSSKMHFLSSGFAEKKTACTDFCMYLYLWGWESIVFPFPPSEDKANIQKQTRQGKAGNISAI